MNTEIFHTIQNNNIAYWLGFIAADGSVTIHKKKGKHFQFGLSSKDREHLEKFLKFIGIEEDTITDRMTLCTTNGKYYPSSYLDIYNDQLFDDLNQYGIVPDKSHQNIDFLSYIPEEYKIPFIIGMIDGDGCFVCTDKTINFGLCGNEAVIKSIHKYLHNYFSHWTSTEGVFADYRSIITYSFTITAQAQILEFCKLYLNYANKCDLLERKKVIVQKIIEALEEKVAQAQKRKELAELHKKLYPHKERVPSVPKICPICGKEFLAIKNDYVYCSQECVHIAQRRCEWPTKEELYQELKENKGNFSAVGRIHGVSDNTIRKWCKKYELPYHTNDYKNDDVNRNSIRGTKRVAQLDPVTKETIAIFNSMKEAAIQVYGDEKKAKQISAVCCENKGTVQGYSWKKIDNN